MSFKKTAAFSYLNSVPITKYKSARTGIEVVIADVEGGKNILLNTGPLVEGAFVLATEAHDNDGCPHVSPSLWSL